MLNAFLRADDKRKRPGMVWWAAQEPEVTAQGHWGSPAGAPHHGTNPPKSQIHLLAATFYRASRIFFQICLIQLHQNNYTRWKRIHQAVHLSWLFVSSDLSKCMSRSAHRVIFYLCFKALLLLCLGNEIYSVDVFYKTNFFLKQRYLLRK